MIDCLTIGISEREFWTLNPHKVKLRIEAYNKKRKQEFDYDNALAHLSGVYIRDALLATVGNMFSKNASFEYPKKPYGAEDIERELTEKEKDEQRRLFVANLELMKANFELNHPPKHENENN